MAEFLTVEDLIKWAESEGIDLGCNPRRMLVYLAGRGVIPKTTRGHRCKGVYRKDEVLSKLSFYGNRRKEGWRIRDIQTAIANLDSAQLEFKPSLPLMDIWKDREEMRLFSLPLADSFKTVFMEFLTRNPLSASSIVRFFDEQEALTGIKVGEAFRKFIGWDSVEMSDTWQMHFEFPEKSSVVNRT